MAVAELMRLECRLVAAEILHDESLPNDGRSFDSPSCTVFRDDCDESIHHLSAHGRGGVSVVDRPYRLGVWGSEKADRQQRDGRQRMMSLLQH